MDNVCTNDWELSLCWAFFNLFSSLHLPHVLSMAAELLEEEFGEVVLKSHIVKQSRLAGTM